MVAVQLPERHLETHIINDTAKELLAKISRTLSNEDFMSVMPNIEYTLKRDIVEDARLLVKTLSGAISGASGCSVFRITGEDPVPFSCSKGPAVILPIRTEDSDGKGAGLKLRVGVSVHINAPVLIQPEAEFVAVFVS